MHPTTAAHPTRFRTVGHGKARTFACLALGAAARAVCPETRAEPSIELQSSLPATPLPLVESWAEDLLDVLNRVFQLMGSTVGTLSSDPNTAMAQVTAAYYARGCPPALTDVQKATQRANVESAWLLSNPILAGTGITVSAFRQMLKSLYADLGGNPALLL
jgi:hypothetical protein